jgi:hypothetical protein
MSDRAATEKAGNDLEWSDAEHETISSISTS